MRPIHETTLDDLEHLATEGARQIRAFFAYQGDNQTYLHKAKIGAAVISAFTRARASESNRMAIDLMERKLGESLSAQRKQVLVGEVSRDGRGLPAQSQDDRSTDRRDYADELSQD